MRIPYTYNLNRDTFKQAVILIGIEFNSKHSTLKEEHVSHGVNHFKQRRITDGIKFTLWANPTYISLYTGLCQELSVR